MCDIMVLMGTATDRNEEYKRQVSEYLTLVSIEKGWSQSEMARLTGLTPSAFSRAFRGETALGFDVVENLADRCGVPISDSLRTAYRLKRAGGERRKVDEFIEASPELRRMAELMMAIKSEADAKRRAEMKAEIQEIMSKVA